MHEVLKTRVNASPVVDVGYRLRQAADPIQTDQGFARTLTPEVMMPVLVMDIPRPLINHLFRWKKEAAQ
ncbi:MAG: hypothetical protein Q8M53_04975 [Burkholderiales bacterium]|nr:hypothetical protein [Burkholderiales bacterium]